MGTSASASGISGNAPIVPSWVDDEHPLPVLDEPRAENDSEDVAPSASPPAANRFSRARNAMSTAVRIVSTGAIRSAGGGGRSARGGRRGGSARRRPPSEEKYVRRALANYTSALGGAENVARRLGVAVDVGADLFIALDRIAREGVDAALRALNLGGAIGAGPIAIVDALMTLVCGEGTAGSLDESIARHACDEMFIGMYSTGITLESLSPEQVPTFIQSFAVESAYAQIERDIADKIIDVPRTESEARGLQRAVRDVVSEAIKLELPSHGSVQQTVGDVRKAIASAYRSAFVIFGRRRQ